MPLQKYDWVAEQEHILVLAKHKISQWKTLEDPFSKMITVKCCKEEPELPDAVYKFIQTCNPSKSSDNQYAIQTLEYLVKHAHWNPCQSVGLNFWLVPGTEMVFCRTCMKHNPIPKPSFSWLHQCKNDEWAVASPGKKPTMRWHMQANCWIFSYSYHNKVDDYLSSQNDASFDKKNSVWLIADKIAPQCNAHIKQWLPDFVWLQNTKRANSVSPRQISAQALHAETILSFLPKDELKSLTRKVFMNLHPDKGGNHEDFIKFKLALEGWEKGRNEK